jgi:hypothetical protein
MRELGVLTGSSVGAILFWEKGKFKPKADKKGALIALRKLGKRQVKRMLAEKAKGKKPETKVMRRKFRRNTRKAVSRKKVVRRARRATKRAKR